MTYREKNILVQLMYSIIIFAYALNRINQMTEAGGPVAIDIFTLWATVIVISIISVIIATIITQIALSIVEAIRTRKEPNFVEDERDDLIELKGIRNTYIVASIGIFISLVSFALGAQALDLFNRIFYAIYIGEIFGNFSRLYFYRRGF